MSELLNLNIEGQKTRYLPASWLDEIIPEPQEDPNMFVFHSEQFGWHMRDPHDHGAADEDSGWVTQLQDGDAVRFSANRVYGDFVLTVHSDGSFATDRPVPADANCFRIGRDTDTLTDSLQDLVNGSSAMGARLEPGCYDMDVYWWSDEEYVFVFELVGEQGVFRYAGVSQ